MNYDMFIDGKEIFLKLEKSPKDMTIEEREEYKKSLSDAIKKTTDLRVSPNDLIKEFIEKYEDKNGKFFVSIGTDKNKRTLVKVSGDREYPCYYNGLNVFLIDNEERLRSIVKSILVNKKDLSEVELRDFAKVYGINVLTDKRYIPTLSDLLIEKVKKVIYDNEEDTAEIEDDNIIAKEVEAKLDITNEELGQYELEVEKIMEAQGYKEKKEIIRNEATRLEEEYENNSKKSDRDTNISVVINCILTFLRIDKLIELITHGKKHGIVSFNKYSALVVKNKQDIVENNKSNWNLMEDTISNIMIEMERRRYEKQCEKQYKEILYGNGNLGIKNLANLRD